MAFEEALAPEHAATVRLATTLRDPKRGRLLDDTFTATAPIPDDDPATMATAMGRAALDEASSAVAAAVAAALHAR